MYVCMCVCLCVCLSVCDRATTEYMNIYEYTLYLNNPMYTGGWILMK